MTKHSISGALLLGATLAASPALQAAELKVGYVNFGRLLGESPQARAAQQALEGEFRPRQRLASKPRSPWFSHIPGTAKMSNRETQALSRASGAEPCSSAS